MRRGVLFFSVCCAATLIFLIQSVWTLLTLLVCNGSEDAITVAELSAPGSSQAGLRQQLIPKIIHQTYKNESVPEVWQSAQASCQALHSDWEYKFWTDESSEEFIALEYPWFLETFLGYQYGIQRADAIRYFALAHYGGVYIDLDDGCNRSLEPLLEYPAWVRKTKPTGVSNDVMGATPRHPFFLRVIDELENYDRSWLLPYVTVMSSTGPLFLSIIWRHWSAEGHNVGDGLDGGRVRILFADEYMSSPWSFFTHHTGSSWHQYDSHLMFLMLQNWVMITAVCFIVGFTCIFVAWLLYDRMLSRTSDRNKWRQSVHFPRRLIRSKNDSKLDFADNHEV